MRKTPEISVVLPTFNRQDLIGEALRSVLCQRIGSMEIIVVDDGSTDYTRRILQPFNKDIRYFYQKNRGVSAARNLGVQESRGEVLAFLDSDDLWIPGKLQSRIGELSNDKDVVCFRGVEWFVDDGQGSACVRSVTHVQWPRCGADGYVTDPVLDIAEGRYLHLGTMLVLRKSFLRVGFFDQTLCLGEDEDWFSRASMVMRFRYNPDPCLRIRLHREQTNLEREESIRSLITVFGNIKSRTSGVHRRASVSANHRLAAKWSHLAGCLSDRGRAREAFGAALYAYSLAPLRLRRLVKVGMMLVKTFGQPAPAGVQGPERPQSLPREIP